MRSRCLQRSPFPFELNEVTREYFTQMAQIEPAATAADMRAILKTPPDEAAIARLSQDPRYNSTMRTTCVADHARRRPCLQRPAAAGGGERQLPHLSRPFARSRSVSTW